VLVVAVAALRRAYFAQRDWRDYVQSLTRALPPPARHDARRAGRALPARGDLDAPEGGLFIWATLPDYIDTTDLLARALRRGERGVRPRAGRVPRRPRRLVDAAELLGRRRG
jgi:2-aminoadipate transaminase